MEGIIPISLNILILELETAFFMIKLIYKPEPEGSVNTENFLTIKNYDVGNEFPDDFFITRNFCEELTNPRVPTIIIVFEIFYIVATIFEAPTFCRAAVA
uniref:Uncharacterized protein n=1 Tax=Megaselia scalaris TaxID=36166 RepID=T1GJF2_MEGSC